MNNITPRNANTRSVFISKIVEIKEGVFRLLKNKFFYISALMVFAGLRMNYFSQSYLHQCVENGVDLPRLSDLVLDNLPYWDIDFIYDGFLMVSVFFFVAYIVHKNQYDRIPFMLTIGGMYYMVRGIFIILTPLGNPPLFDGTESMFNGFAKYELGMYPSGHTGISFLFFLFTENKRYRAIILSCILVIIAAMFFARGHYSIDILSAIFFAYALKSFGDKYLLNILYKPAVSLQE